MLWKVVLVTSDVDFTGGNMLVVVVLGLQQTLSLVNLGIKLNPLLVRRVGDALAVDTGLAEPVLDSIDGVLWWSEEIDDLFS